MKPIAAKLAELAALKALERWVAERKAIVEDEAIALMKSADQRTASTMVDGDKVTATLVEAERVVIDPDRLKKALNATQWRKVTKQVLDREKLEAAVALNEVDAVVVAEASETVKNRPYLRVSGGKAHITPPDLTPPVNAPKPRKVRAKALQARKEHDDAG